MLMEIYIKDNDSLIKRMDKELILMLMVLNMKDNEKKIDSMVEEWKYGLMELDTKAIINLVKNMEKAF